MKHFQIRFIPRKSLVHDVDIIQDGEVRYTIHSRHPLDPTAVQRIRDAFQDDQPKPLPPPPSVIPDHAFDPYPW